MGAQEGRVLDASPVPEQKATTDAEAVVAQQKLGLDLTEHNADGGLTLPMPTTVVVDAIGVIRWIDVHPNYTTRSEVPDILAAVDSVS